MISTRELKDQIEQLTEQNQSLTEELQQIKKLIQNQSNNQNQQNKNSENDNNSGGGNEISNIANDFLIFKDLTNQLELKMQKYVSNHSTGKTISQEDVIHLILNMMNGMIDWAMDYVSRQQKQQSN
jgi:predicted RNase H-like nuclease (RuvC/YqgF family)